MKTSKHDSANDGPIIGGLRIAKVSYDFHPIRQSRDGYSIGAFVDKHIADTIANGSLVSEVSLFFETREQQESVCEYYRPRNTNESVAI